MAGIDYNHEVSCGLSVGDLDRAIEWYERVLGFKLPQRMNQIGFAVLETPVEGVVLGLGKADAVEPRGAELTWGVKDIEAALSTLEAAGARIDGPIHDIPGVVRLLGFFDPDGNRHQFWAPPAG